MTAPVCPADGLAYTDHPPADPPSTFYARVRSAFIDAIARIIYLPDVSESHRRAIIRARTERRVLQ